MISDTYIMFLIFMAGLLCALLLLFISRVFRPGDRREYRGSHAGESDGAADAKPASIGLHYFFNLISFIVLDVLLVILILFGLILRQSGTWALAGFGAILILIAAGFLFVNRQVSAE